jgi:error-prone DNA polymerase
MVFAWSFLMIAYAELAVTTNYSFLCGASHPRELVEKAAELGHAAIGIADRNTLAGVVRAYAALQELKGTAPYAECRQTACAERRLLPYL